MAVIYAIEDINDKIYIGSTKQKLNRRLVGHRRDKRNNVYVSSSKLNLDYCIIYELEKCEEKDRKEREEYWINKLESVNDYKLNFDKTEYMKEYRKRKKEYQKERYHKNKEEIKRKNKEYYIKNKKEINRQQIEYQKKNRIEINRKRSERYHKNKQELSD